MFHSKINSIISEISLLPEYITTGIVVKVKGLLIEAGGLFRGSVSIGSLCKIINANNNIILCEVIGVKEDGAFLMSFDTVHAIGYGLKVIIQSNIKMVYPTLGWLGRVVNAFGEPIDNKGPLPKGDKGYTFENKPPNAHQRKRITEKLNIGIKAINSFLTCCKGQRMGIIAGSGVGKSVLLGMISKFADTDIKIIGLIGERGREVQEFLQDCLGEEGLSKAVVVVATSDEAALARKQAAYLTMTLCEYYRDLGLHVLCMLDSVTRFAMAQREIGLVANEPPTTKGYPPSIFSEMPKLLERAGPGTNEQGDITALFTVLAEGDDQNDPIVDTVRSIVDGHIVLDRNLAAKGVFPAVNILSSISRTMPRCNTEEETKIVNRARDLLATYDDMSDMIKIGVYQKGSDKGIDDAIHYFPHIMNFIKQQPDENENMANSYLKLQKAIGL